MTKLTEERIKELSDEFIIDRMRPGAGWRLSHVLYDFARAIEAELQPVQEPVVWAIGVCGEIADVFLNKDEAALAFEYRQKKYPDASRKLTPLYLAPPDQTAEIERLRNLSACEACAEIPSVMEYFKQCEERIATLESALRNLLNAVNDRYAAQHHGLLVLGGSAIDEAKAALGEE